LGKLIPALGGLDAIVFTAGIGENSSTVRRNICNRLIWLGVELDETANEENATNISAAGSGIDVLVIPTNEEAVIARSVRGLIAIPGEERGAAR
jgi:acetate kinase